MPKPTDALVERLRKQARPRADLITPGSTGKLENARPFVYAGRLAKGEESIHDLLQRAPLGELEQGGLAMQAPELLKAAIPISFWRSFSPETKAALTNVANRFPVTFENVLKAEKLLYANITRGVQPGALATYEPKRVADIILARPEHASKSEVILHELTHYLQQPRIARTSPTDAETIGRLLSEFIPPNKQPSVQWRREQLASLPMFFGGEIPQDMKEILQRSVMDEAMAHAADTVATNEAPSTLKLLAARLGILPE